MRYANMLLRALLLLFVYLLLYIYIMRVYISQREEESVCVCVFVCLFVCLFVCVCTDTVRAHSNFHMCSIAEPKFEQTIKLCWKVLVGRLSISYLIDPDLEACP